jgi:toxin ParE1/3/4
MKSNTNHILVLTEESQDDIRHIYHHTQTHWGATQADSYCEKIRSAFLTLTHAPSIGRAAAFASELRLFSVERHVLVYKIDNGRIILLRILFAGMDPQIHL